MDRSTELLGSQRVPVLRDEILRLQKVIRALMDRAERSTNMLGSEFNVFQTAILLEEQVRRRTEDLESALHENEKINRALQQAKERLEQEIQEHVATQDALFQSEERYRVATEAALDAFLTLDEKFVIVFANPAAERIFGYPASDLLGKELTMLMPAALHQANLSSIRSYLRADPDAPARNPLQLACMHRYGRRIDMEFSFGAFLRNRRIFFTAIARDITERKQTERKVQALQEALREKAVRDALTGVYNRHYLAETFKRELSRAQRMGRSLSLVICDIDYFKSINDTYGHLVGDKVLKAFAQALLRQARASDIVCRYGGEEFLLLLPDMEGADAVGRAERLRRYFETMSVPCGDDDVYVTASFGVATFPENGHTGPELIDAVDHALYAAKTAGRNCVRRHAAMTDEVES